MLPRQPVCTAHITNGVVQYDFWQGVPRKWLVMCWGDDLTTMLLKDLELIQPATEYKEEKSECPPNAGDPDPPSSFNRLQSTSRKGLNACQTALPTLVTLSRRLRESVCLYTACLYRERHLTTRH
jgi:hypothetical protein